MKDRRIAIAAMASPRSLALVGITVGTAAVSTPIVATAVDDTATSNMITQALHLLFVGIPISGCWMSTLSSFLVGNLPVVASQTEASSVMVKEEARGSIISNSISRELVDSHTTESTALI
jgi:hypothetical protein